MDPVTGSLHIQDIRRDDAGQYVCIGFNGAGERESMPTRLSVRGTDGRSLVLASLNEIRSTVVKNVSPRNQKF